MSKRRILSGVHYGDRPTPEQQAEAEKEARDWEAFNRWKCDWLRFWQACGNKSCRRNKRCSGDAEACWRERWGAAPQILKTHLGLAIKHMREGMPPLEAFRTAHAQIMRTLEAERPGGETAGAVPVREAVKDAAAPANARLSPRVEPPRPRARML